MTDLLIVLTMNSERTKTKVETYRVSDNKSLNYHLFTGEEMEVDEDSLKSKQSDGYWYPLFSCKSIPYVLFVTDEYADWH